MEAQEASSFRETEGAEARSSHLRTSELYDAGQRYVPIVCNLFGQTWGSSYSVPAAKWIPRNGHRSETFQAGEQTCPTLDGEHVRSQ